MKLFFSFIILFLVLMVVSAINSFGQEDPLYAQYLNNPILINPAYTGIKNNFSTAVSYRKQWAGFEGSPTTLNFNSQISLAHNKMGLGLIVLQDNIGNNSNTESYATYSYKIHTQNGVMAFGLQGGLINYSSVNTQLTTYDPSDPAFSSDVRLTKPNFGSGFVYRTDRIFFGFSVPRMMKIENALNDAVTNLYSQHYYANAAYVFFLTERVRLKPSILLKGVKGSPVSLDYNLFVNLDEKFTVGIFTRNLNTYGTLLQMKLGELFQFGYAFEVPTHKSVGPAYATHELCVSMSLGVLSFHEKSLNSF